MLAPPLKLFGGGLAPPAPPPSSYAYEPHTNFRFYAEVKCAQAQSCRLALVGYIKLFIICIFFIVLDISLISFILIVNVWLV